MRVLEPLSELVPTHQSCSSRASVAQQSPAQRPSSPPLQSKRPLQRERAAIARSQAASSYTAIAFAQVSSATTIVSARIARIAFLTSNATNFSTLSEPRSTSHHQPIALPTQLRVGDVDARSLDAAKTTASASSRACHAQPGVPVALTARTTNLQTS